LALEWLNDPGYQNWQVFSGFVIGVISAFLCIGVMVTVGINKQIFYRIRQRLKPFPFLQEVLPPTIGGLVIGLVNWALPLTVGNGSLVFNYLIGFGCDGDVSQKLLLCTGFARMVLLGVSMNCGFCGGIIFPFLTMGMIGGTITYLNYPYIPKGLCIGAFMVALPSGVVPMPFTFTALSVFIFYFGLYQIAPIFVATITSYLIVSGSGLLKKMVTRATQNQQAAEELEEQKTQKESDEDFTIKQYMGNKKTVATGGTVATY
jgi:H+/Cl- antiporter ClcA